MTKYRPPHRMKLKPFATRMFSALAGALLVCSNQSEAALNYNDGDLFLSFRATGGTGATVDYMVNLGSFTTFRDATSVLVLDTEIGNLLADLNGQYGLWQNRADVYWSVSGVQRFAGQGFATNHTMFATAAHTSNLSLGLQDSTAWSRGTSFTLQTPSGSIKAMGDAFAQGNGVNVDTVQSSNVPLGLIQPTANPNSFASKITNGGTTAFGYFTSSTGIEGNFGNGTGGSVLDLYTVAIGTAGAAGEFEGTFSINNNATVTFTPAIPEPASFAALAGGLAVLASVRRRRVNS